ncbi:MAG: HAD superfamily hydrolase (TIGR01484 family), partial [Acidimicrobiales bacterium]
MSQAPGLPVQLIATDLDGTLLNDESKVSPRTVAALQAASAAGVHVAAATGRSHRTASGLLTPIGVIDWAICSNGATLFDLANEKVVAHTFLGLDAAQAVMGAKAALPGLGLAWETPDGLFRDRAMHIQMTRRYGPNVWALEADPPIKEVADRLIKVMVGHPDHTHDGLIDMLTAELDHDLEVSSSGADFIEITAGSAEKGQAVARLCAQLGVDQAGTV